MALPSAAWVLLGWSQQPEYPWDSLGGPIEAAFTHSSQRFFRQGGYSPQGRTALGGCAPFLDGLTCTRPPSTGKEGREGAGVRGPGSGQSTWGLPSCCGPSVSATGAPGEVSARSSSQAARLQAPVCFLRGSWITAGSCRRHLSPRARPRSSCSGRLMTTRLRGPPLPLASARGERLPGKDQRLLLLLLSEGAETVPAAPGGAGSPVSHGLGPGLEEAQRAHTTEEPPSRPGHPISGSDQSCSVLWEPQSPHLLN